MANEAFKAMVNGAQRHVLSPREGAAARLPELGEAERLALAYAPRGLRAAYAALLALDTALRRSALGGHEPFAAQLKLAWWRDQCGRLPRAAGHPVLEMLAADDRLPSDLLVGLVDAWEEIAVGDAFADSAHDLARQRAAAYARLGDSDASLVEPAACVWTFATLAAHAPDPAQRDALRDSALALPPVRLPSTLRPLTVLSGLARRALVAERATLVGDRWSGFAAMRLGIFGR